MIDKGYEKELNYFLVRVVAPAIGGDSWERFRPDLLNAIKSEIEINLAASNAHDFDDPVPSHPIHFEQWCVTRLTQSGWRARPTPASGDQGADVVATKDQTKIVVQCKLYQSTVGNKAVQEIAAARTHYEAHHALVVAPNGFTKAARQLAATNKVYLIHPDQLAQIDAVICGENP